jgi:hypothetical protein
MQTTGVGSLPHEDQADAAAWAAAPSIPYLPQLPNRHPEEGMLLQWGDGLCGCGPGAPDAGLRFGVAPGPRDEAFVGAGAALGALTAAPPPLVKTQATGPITLATAMAAGGHPGDGLWECVVAGLVERITEHLAWVAGRLPGSQILLVVDEPALVAVDRRSPGARDALDALSRVVRQVEPADVGIHCCGDADWGAVAAVGADWFSFDTSELGARFVDGVPDLARAVAAGSRIIWGAVPTDSLPLPSVETLVSRVRRAEGLLVLAGADVRRLDEGAVSPACGLARLTVDTAAQVSALVDDVAEALS